MVMDLNDLKNKPTSAPVSPEEQAKLDELADRMDTRQEINTGFQILIFKDGRIVLDTTIDPAKYKAAKADPGLTDIFNAVSTILSDLEAQKHAQHVVMALQQAQEQAFQQIQAQKIAQNLSL